MGKKKAHQAIELSEKSAAILRLASFKANSRILDSAIIKHRSLDKSVDHLLGLVWGDFTEVRGEADLLHSKLTETHDVTEWRNYVAAHPPGADVIAYLLVLHESHLAEEARVKASAKGRRAADALHDKPGGSRSKSDEIRLIWASGKYSSRDICAEQECAGLDMSFSTARKALRGTPNQA